MRGKPILRFQQALALEIGVPQNSIFDEQTKLAVQTFQRDNDLPDDGKVGNMTFGSFVAARHSGITKKALTQRIEGRSLQNVNFCRPT